MVAEPLDLRPPRPAEAEAVQALWEASLAADDPGGRPRGGWSVAAWATAARVLTAGDDLVGVVAVRYEPRAEAAAARIALAPGHREAHATERLVVASIDLARAAGAPLVRLFVPASATWALAAARAAGFRHVRTIYHMLRPAEVGPFGARPVGGLRIRPLRAGEEPALLAALNRAWAGTWSFQPITAAMLARDLEGQREGMLVGVDAADPARIVATCHAIFDPADRNPDGSPHAWISNLTTDPSWRGRGVGRAMLAAALDHLRARGAGSVGLGVDAGNEAPLGLYRAAGFAVVSSLEAWERPTRRGPARTPPPAA